MSKKDGTVSGEMAETNEEVGGEIPPLFNHSKLRAWDCRSERQADAEANEVNVQTTWHDGYSEGSERR